MAQDFFEEIKTVRLQLEDKARQAVDIARRQGADECEVVIGRARGLEVTTRRTQTENIEFSQDCSLGLVVFKGKCRGSASTTDLSESSLCDCAAAALGIAAHTDPDPCAGICERELLCRKPDDFDLLKPLTDDPEQALRLAAQTESLALASQDKRLKDSDGAYFSAATRQRIIANSHDFCVSSAASSHSFGLTLIGEQDGIMQRGSGFALAAAASDLVQPQQVADEALQHTFDKLGAFKPKSGRYNVIFTDSAARSLWGHLQEAIHGYNIYLKSSFLCDRLNSQILPEFLSIREEPHLRGVLGARSFDGEGAATFAQDWVKEGRLLRYLLSTYTSRKLGLAKNAHAGGSSLVFVKADDAHSMPLAELMRKAGDGLVINSLMGQGVDIVSGNYSRGASGYFFKNGERVQAAHEFTVAADLRDLFLHIAALGTDVDERYKLRTGSILIPDLAISGA